jgi:hypothetical protein
MIESKEGKMASGATGKPRTGGGVGKAAWAWQLAIGE